MQKKTPPKPVDEQDEFQFLKSGMEFLDQGFIIVGPDLTIRAVNAAHIKMFEYPKVLARAGTPVYEVYLHLAKQGVFGKGSPEKIARERVKKIDQGLWGSELLILADNRVIEIMRSTMEGGGFVAVTTDVTEREKASEDLRQSEERFRDFAEVASDWFWEMGADLRISYVSNRWTEITGIELEQIVGTRRGDLSAEPTNTEKWRIHNDDQEARRPFRDFEYEAINSQGAIHHIVLHGIPIFDADGEFKGYRGIGQDVTKERAAERALLETNSLLEATLDAIDEGLIVVDKERTVLAVNRRYKELWDVPEELLIDRSGEKIRDLVADQLMDKEHFMGRMEEHYKDPSMSSQDQLYLKDGRVFERVAKPQYMENEIVGRVISVRDITAQVRAEEAIKDSVSLLTATLEATADGIFAIDLERRIVSFNDQGLNMWGIDKAFVEKNPNQQLGLTLAKQIKNPEEYLEQVDHVHDNPSDDQFIRLELKDGRVIDRMSRPQRRDGRIVGRVLSFRDVTNQVRVSAELESQKNLFEAVFKDVPDAMILADTNRRTTMINPAVTRMFGYEPDDVVGKKTAMFYESKAEFERMGHLRYNMTADQLAEPFVVNYRRKDGSLFPGETVGSPMRDQDGNLFGFMGAIRDVSARIAVEQELQTALKMAEGANQAKSEFLANVSHDLRTPLNAILGFSEMMELQVLGPLGSNEYLTYASDIHNSGGYLLDLVNDLLDISTIETGKRQLVNEPINLADIVDECMKAATGKQPHAAAKITTRVADDLPQINADQRALKQIILNLLSNSIRFTPKTGRITVSVKAKKKTLEIAIHDTGKGIPKKRLSRITAAFERGQAHPYSTADGTGLGLTIARSLTEMHGGNLQITSQVGKGTTVKVNLPYGG